MEEKKTALLNIIEHEGTFHFKESKFQEVRDLKCRDDDIWVCSFPRSGTTLTQQTVYLIQTLDFEKASTIPLEDRFPMIEIEIPGSEVIFRGPDYVIHKPENEQRMIKSHLHYRLLPRELQNGKGKIIYITRNPRAAIVSLFKVQRYIKLKGTEDFREYLGRFLRGENMYCCPWGLHILEYWDRRNDSNILFLQYENSVQDRVGTVRKIADFLGKVLTDEQVNKIVEHTSLESMKYNPAVNFAYFEQEFDTDKTDGEFINSGKITGWQKEIPEDLWPQFDEFVEKEIGHTDIKF